MNFLGKFYFLFIYLSIIKQFTNNVIIYFFEFSEKVNISRKINVVNICVYFLFSLSLVIANCKKKQP